jgi:hypothetical protein
MPTTDARRATIPRFQTSPPRELTAVPVCDRWAALRPARSLFHLFLADAGTHRSNMMMLKLRGLHRSTRRQAVESHPAPGRRCTPDV